MAANEIYELTHPEILSETQLKEILKSRCIDFSNYENATRIQLIELYKRVALPLPRRETNELRKSSESLEIAEDSCKDFSETRNNSTTAEGAEYSKSSQLKKHRLNDCSRINDKLSNGLEKRDDAPLKKRQKITWP